MKTLVVSAFLFMIVTHLHAQSAFSVSMWDRSMFTVVFDGKLYNNPTQEFHIDGLAPGRYTLSLARRLQSSRGQTANQTIFSGVIDIPSSSTVTYLVNQYRGLDIVSIVSNNMYNDPVGAQQLSPTELQDLLFRMNQARFDRDKVNLVKQAANDRDFSSGQVYQLLRKIDFESSRLDLAKHLYAFTIDKENYNKVFPVFAFDSYVQQLEDHMYQYDALHANDNYQPNNAPNLLSATDLDALLRTLDAISFDKDKYQTACNAIQNRDVYSQQVKEIIQRFSFESTRLDFAKFAYGNTVDPGNYFTISSTLRFDSSVRELNNYIANF